MKFTVKRADRSADKTVKVGDVVYLCREPDYGCARDDEKLDGIVRLSVTRDSTGDYPFFTIPCADLEHAE